MSEIHIGQAIKEELAKQGRKVSWFSEQLGKSKSATHYLFRQPSIAIDELRRISRILNYDFFHLLSESLENGTEKDEC